MIFLINILISFLLTIGIVALLWKFLVFMYMVTTTPEEREIGEKW